MEQLPFGFPPPERNRRAERAWTAVGGVLVLVAGGFVTLVLLWMASWDGEWGPSAADRRKCLIGAAVVFTLTIALAWRILRGARPPHDDWVP